MFGTIRYLRNNQTGEFLERETRMVGSAPTNKPRHVACDYCRVKKIRCSGQQAGCSRCKTLSLLCKYTHAPAWRYKRKSTFNLPQQLNLRNENRNDLGYGTAPGRYPPTVAAATDAVQPSLITGQILHIAEDNHLALDTQTQLGSRISDIFEDVPTWSDYLNWSPGSEVACDPEPGFPISENRPLTPDPLMLGHPLSENTVQQQQPPPPIAHESLPPDLILTPRSNPTLQNRPSGNNSNFPAEEQTTCSCLNSAVLLLDELQAAHCDNGSPGEQGLDSILSIYQEVLILGMGMVHCDICRGKSENMMVLAMVLERLAILCGGVIDAFIAQGKANVDVNKNQPERLILGEYQVEGGDYEVMMGMLVTRRLLALQFLITRMKTISTSTRRPHQQARMARVDQHLKSLFQKLTIICPLATKWKIDASQSLL
ncbi:hypothetical protein BP00DRAFT_387228 [Aspergillus indologenus CBS 114.80]|uniref:Zn(2)-C6 fungal-type domain-containing protein n=1 Tax=Aspergillus indologenus CBS 114.80 TaxID=1450541 RepID=A0A2V5J2B8_9EURO|nr:hypothetical protein BP00DRAFT_387228 [Aspergillus indologenus CBS 114.80]